MIVRGRLVCGGSSEINILSGNGYEQIVWPVGEKRVRGGVVQLLAT